MSDRSATPHGTPWAPPRINGFRHVTTDALEAPPQYPALDGSEANVDAVDELDPSAYQTGTWHTTASFTDRGRSPSWSPDDTPAPGPRAWVDIREGYATRQELPTVGTNGAADGLGSSGSVPGGHSGTGYDQRNGGQGSAGGHGSRDGGSIGYGSGGSAGNVGGASDGGGPDGYATAGGGSGASGNGGGGGTAYSTRGSGDVGNGGGAEGSGRSAESAGGAQGGFGADGGGSRAVANGYGSNGYGSNGYGSNGYGTGGHGTGGNDSNGQGSNGQGSNGHGSNGDGYGGAALAGHEAIGTGSDQGSGNHGSNAPGSSAQGLSAQGSNAQGSSPRGSSAQGSADGGLNGNGAHANAWHDNRSDGGGSGGNGLGGSSNGYGSNGTGNTWHSNGSGGSTTGNPGTNGHAPGGSLVPYAMDPLAPRVHAGWDAPRASTTANPTVQIDYELVTALQNEVSRQLIDALRGEVGLTNADRRRLTEEFAERVVLQNVESRLRAGESGPVTWPGYTEALQAAVCAYLIGLGRLQPLIDNPDIENIMVLGTRVRVVYANGAIDEESFRSAASDEELIALLQRLAERGGQTERSLSTTKPILHLRLPDGARLTVIYVVTARPVVVIRRHRVKDVSLADMVSMGAITPTLKAFLEAAVRAHMNIMIAGRANAGKTTLLRAIADEIPREEWFCVMETVGELGLDQTGRHPWAVCFEEREGFGEKGADGRPEGELTIDDLFPHMLRLSANRIIVGEVRAQEIVAMFDAMNTTYGSLCTIHSRDEHGVFDRLAELLLRYGASKNREGAYLTVGNALDLVVYVNMDEAPGYRPRRYVSSVIEVHGLGEGRQLSRSRIFAPGPNGLAVPTSVRMSERRSAELQAAGFDMRQLLTPELGYLPGGAR